MSRTLHRDGIAAVLAPVTGAGSGKFAAGYRWPRRNLADPNLKYPFWSLDSTVTSAGEDPITQGEDGENFRRVTTRVLMFEHYADTEERYDAFEALIEAALTELRSHVNVRLGQETCLLNTVTSDKIEFVTTTTPALMVGTILCQATYAVQRT